MAGRDVKVTTSLAIVRFAERSCVNPVELTARIVYVPPGILDDRGVPDNKAVEVVALNVKDKSEIKLGEKIFVIVADEGPK